MAEPRDDKVSAAYRAMAPTEPPAARDDAIRAAARRAVQAGPVAARRRWALPVSVAAVLALSIGIALHVEREKPVVIDGTPLPAGNAEYPVAQEPAEPAVKPPPPQAVPAAKPDASREAPRASEASRQPGTVEPAAPPPPATIATPPSTLSPPPPANATTRPPATAASSVPAPALRAADRARDEAVPMRAPRESGAAGVAKEMAAVTPEKQLERIAELRAAGRHGEADEALARFRRDHPDYRIPPDLWEKVSPR